LANADDVTARRTKGSLNRAGNPASEELHLELASFQVRTVHVRDLGFSAREGSKRRRDVHHFVFIEVNARDRVVRLWLTRLFLDVERPAKFIEIHHSLALRIPHGRGKYGRPAARTPGCGVELPRESTGRRRVPTPPVTTMPLRLIPPQMMFFTGACLLHRSIATWLTSSHVVETLLRMPPRAHDAPRVPHATRFGVLCTPADWIMARLHGLCCEICRILPAVRVSRQLTSILRREWSLRISIQNGLRHSGPPWPQSGKRTWSELPPLISLSKT
jgi:hypothetical protein